MFKYAQYWWVCESFCECVCVCVCVCACMCVYVRDICRFNTPIVTLSHTYISSFCSNLIDADQWKYTDMGLSGVNFVCVNVCVCVCVCICGSVYRPTDSLRAMSQSFCIVPSDCYRKFILSMTVYSVCLDPGMMESQIQVGRVRRKNVHPWGFQVLCQGEGHFGGFLLQWCNLVLNSNFFEWIVSRLLL